MKGAVWWQTDAAMHLYSLRLEHLPVLNYPE